MTLSTKINPETLQDLIGIRTGLYAPLGGFMTSLDYEKVVNDMKLSDDSIWPIPVTLDVTRDVFRKAVKGSEIGLIYGKKRVAFIKVDDRYKVDPGKDVKKIFKTGDINHPGVKKELEKSVYRIGGRTFVTDRSILKGALDPEKTKRLFRQRGWQTVVGFQTRNPIHAAHEYLQRVGLDICDGLFINPSVGWKKKGDFSEEAVIEAYKYMINSFYPKDRVHLEGLRVHFRYAGPREAVFHAILRKNLGCTHFIIGRDHAGVGKYYGVYEAHDLAKKISEKNDLGIKLLLLKEPYFCKVCSQIVTEKHCKHSGDDIERISGSFIRDSIKNRVEPDARFIRPEIYRILLNLGNKRFVK